MRSVIEPKTPTSALPTTLLVPLHVEYATTVADVPLVTGEITYDDERQITLFDGVPIAESDRLAQMGITKSTRSTDGQDAIAVDEGPDDSN